MKFHDVFIALALFLLAPSAITYAEDSLHTFTSPDGRALSASILEYNDRNGKIRIERKDGRKLWIHPTVFSQNSQHYIRQWILVDKFMSTTAFRIQTEISKDTATSYFPVKDRCKERETTSVEYEITLNNRSDSSFQDLKIEFRSFIRIQESGDKDDWSRVVGGCLLVDDLPAGATFSKQAPPVELLTKYKMIKEWSIAAQIYTYYSTMKTEDKLKGTWIRVYGPELDGKPSIREWCYPSDTMRNYLWTDDYEQVAAVFSEAVASSSPPARKEHPMRGEVLSLMRQGSKCMRSDPEKALEMLQEAYRKSNSANIESRIESHIESQIGLCYIRYLKPNNITLGVEWLTKAAERDNLGACCRLARFYSTYIDPQYHDAKKGIEYGLKAVSLNPENYNGYDVLAEAYSRDGQFDKAVEQQLIANKLYKESGGSAQGITNMEEALQRYRDHIPCPPY